MNEQQNYFYGLIPVEVRMTPERKEEILQQYPAPVLPDDGATFEIDQEAKGNNVTLRLLLNEVSVQTTKTNKQFLKMTFSNNAGTIQAKMWDNQGAVQKNLPQLEAYSVFDVDAVVDEFRGFKSLTIQRLEPCEGEINPFSYLPYTKQSITDYTVEVFSYIDELSSPYREFAIAVMDQFWQEFSISPAAKGFHHNYLGGLLKHTVGLMRFARYIVKQEENPYQAVMKLIQIVEKAYKQELWSNYESEERWVRPVWQETIDHLYQMLTGMMEHKEEVVNYDALLTSILLHDIGKMLEYDFAGKQYDSFDFLYPTLDKSSLKKRKQTGIAMDQLGVMIGHIPYGILILTKMVEQEGTAFTIEDIHLMSHCILCHHGLPEWGASVKPQTIEGYLIHIVDYLDSRYENTETVK